jgi:hypothetical protein
MYPRYTPRLYRERICQYGEQGGTEHVRDRPGSRPRYGAWKASRPARIAYARWTGAGHPGAGDRVDVVANHWIRRINMSL